MTFRKNILKSIKVPVGRISFTKDKWGELATVYFNGVSAPISIGDDDNDVDMFLRDVKNGSQFMINEARKCFGDNWKKHIKCRG